LVVGPVREDSWFNGFEALLSRDDSRYTWLSSQYTFCSVVLVKATMDCRELSFSDGQLVGKEGAYLHYCGLSLYTLDDEGSRYRGIGR